MPGMDDDDEEEEDEGAIASDISFVVFDVVATCVALVSVSVDRILPIALPFGMYLANRVNTLTSV
jgi:hypothetical protein